MLQYLLTQAGQVVTQDALLDAVWGPTAISDTVVRRSIGELRAVLGDTAQQPQFIQTVHRRGYRFIAPVTLTDTPPSLPAPRQRCCLPHPTRPRQSLRPTASPAARSLDEEYKLVTVLCCAVTDAPSLAVHCGPEAFHRLMQGFFEAAQEVIRRYDGTIVYVTGEDFTAVFGAPIGQEDHARRAVLAALELAPRLGTQAFGEAHAPRMGLHTGPVVISRLTYAPQQPYTAVGDTMHQASQVQRLAPSGVMLLSAATYRLVHDEIRCDAYGALATNNPGGPLPVYRLQSLMQRRAGVAGQGSAIGVALWGGSGNSHSCTNVSRMRPKDRGTWWVLAGSLAWGSRGCWQNSTTVWRVMPCPIAKGTAFPIVLPLPISRCVTCSDRAWGSRRPTGRTS